MTDRETLIEMFGRAGVRWTEATDGDALDCRFKQTATAIKVEEQGDNPPNSGYTEFYTTFGFDADGRLLWVGAWE